MKKLLTLTLIVSLNHAAVLCAAGQVPKRPSQESPATSASSVQAKLHAMPDHATAQTARFQSIAESAADDEDPELKYALELSMGLQPQASRVGAGAGSGSGSASGAAGSASETESKRTAAAQNQQAHAGMLARRGGMDAGSIDNNWELIEGYMGASAHNGGSVSQSAGAAGAKHSDEDIALAACLGMTVEKMIKQRNAEQHFKKPAEQKGQATKIGALLSLTGQLFGAADKADRDWFSKLTTDKNPMDVRQCLSWRANSDDLKNGQFKGDTFAHVAARHNNALDFFKLAQRYDIINNDKNSRGQTPMDIAQERGDIALVKFLEQHLPKKDTPDFEPA